MGALRITFRALLVACACALPGAAHAAEVRAAVAANFGQAGRVLADEFEAETGHTVEVVSGASGKHFAQIKHGAPFDVFLSADRERPELLEQAGLVVDGVRFTYASGRIVLWSSKDNYVDADGHVLSTESFSHLAIANPKLAPYGRAAAAVLRTMGLWSELQPRIVMGENINQAYQFVKTGNAELGFVAYSHIKRPGRPVSGSYWEVPRALYPPIDQQAVLLVSKPAAREFLDFLRSDRARDAIVECGFDAP